MTPMRFIAAACAAALALPLAGHAQVVREDGAKSIAGVLYKEGSGMPAFAEWTFKSAGGEILFASLDADIYRKSKMGAHEEAALAAADEGGGCGGGEDEGGMTLFKIKVLSPLQVDPLCEASRPAPPPGWQRDPRMGCVLPATSGQVTYTIRVELAPMGGDGHTVAMLSNGLPEPHPFLLNISLRKIAKSGTNIQSAIAASSAGGF
jgi:hypothetical protein